MTTPPTCAKCGGVLGGLTFGEYCLACGWNMAPGEMLDRATATLRARVAQLEATLEAAEQHVVIARKATDAEHAVREHAEVQARLWMDNYLAMSERCAQAEGSLAAVAVDKGAERLPSRSIPQAVDVEALTAARLSAEGERDRLREALQDIAEQSSYPINPSDAFYEALERAVAALRSTPPGHPA